MFNTIKILGVYYSYDKYLENQEYFINLVLKIETLLRLWRKRKLSIAGKISVFQTLAIPISTILELTKIKKCFTWKNEYHKIKQDTLCKNYENCGLKDVDITFKIISLQCSWVKKLYDSSTHGWKPVPLHIMTQKLIKHFLFHSNLFIDSKKNRQFPKYYQQVLSKWGINLSVPPWISSSIASQIIWYIFWVVKGLFIMQL